MNTFVLVLSSAFFSGNVIGRELPSFIRVCHRHDPKLDDCLAENVNKLIPLLKKGVPELFIPPFDPLLIPSATLDSGTSFNATFKNLKVYNADNIVLKRRSVDLDKLHLVLEAVFPSIRIMSNYEIHGKILILQIDSTGPSDGNFTNVYGKLVVNGKPYMKKGKEHVKWEYESMEVKIESAHLQFENVFGENQELNDRANKIVNDNIQELITQLMSVAEKVIGAFMFGIVNKVFDKFSMDELFLDP